MREMELRYLAKDVAERIDQIVQKLAAGDSDVTSDNIIDKVTELLPIQKLHQDTIRRRVEGYYLASELLWQTAIELLKKSRAEIVRMAKLKPLSYYHYLTGSREPSGIVMTRDDFLNDPATAMVKLRDDIIGLAKIIPEAKK